MNNLLIFTLLVCCCLQGISQRQQMPDFSFPRMDNGKAFTRGDLAKGKKILLIFFDTGCPHCQEALTGYNAHIQDLTKVAVYLITQDLKVNAMAFLQTHAPRLMDAPNVTILRDSKNQFISFFQPQKYPSMFLYGKDHKLIKYSDLVEDVSIFLRKCRE